MTMDTHSSPPSELYITMEDEEQTLQSIEKASLPTISSTSSVLTNSTALDEDIEESLANTQITKKKTVSFSTVEFREYPICVGDNPGALLGIPVSIDWGYNEDETSNTFLDIDEYEAARPERRSKDELIMTATDRKL